MSGLEAYKAVRTWNKNISLQENINRYTVFYEQANSDFKEAMRLLTEHFRKLWY